MSFGFERLANGYYRAGVVWPRGRQYRVDLKLTDPSGDVDERTVIWGPDEDMPFVKALILFAARINAEPHWRVWFSFDEISIAPDEPYPYEVTLERL